MPSPSQNSPSVRSFARGSSRPIHRSDDIPTEPSRLPQYASNRNQNSITANTASASFPPAVSLFIDPSRRATPPSTTQTGNASALSPNGDNQNARIAPESNATIPERYIFIPMPSRTPSPQPQQRVEPSAVINGPSGATDNSAGIIVRGRGRGRGQTRRGRGRGARRGRGRGRSSLTYRARTTTPSRTEDPSARWTVNHSSVVKLMLEKDYVHKHVSQGARLFCSAAMERLTIELDVKKLNRTRSNVFVLLCDELVTKCCEWLGELSVLKRKHEGSITVPNLYRYLSVMIFSQCTGCSFSKTVYMLEKLGGRKLNQDILNFINNNILAYAATGRGEDESLVWNAQRDQTVMLSQFERSTFRMTARIFLSPNHTVLSLDDDLMGTRATDNQVKTISHRKADGEGHIADVLADALFRVVLQMRFRRRHDKLEHCVEKVVSSLLDTRGDLSRQGMVVVADRGYAKRNVLNALMDQGLSCFGVMPEFILKCHPFVGKSYLKIASFVEDEEDDNDGEQEAEGVEEERLVYDRPVRFVVDDGPTLGPGVSVAKSSYKPKERAREKLTAIAVREYGNAKHSKIVRFMYSMRAPWPESLFTWVAIPYDRSFRGYLFTTRDDNGRIVEPVTQTYRSVLEQHLLQCCDVLTVGQRCADWFVMRQFRVTATMGSKIVTCCSTLREEMVYEPKEIPFEISDPAELVKELCKSWFTTTRASEAMMRGTINENAVLNFLKRQSYTKALFCVGLLAVKDSPWLASSPDAILMLDMSKMEEPFYAEHVLPCTVEIKTSVSPSTMQDRTSLATRDFIIMHHSDPDLKKYIPQEHIGHIVHQAVTANVIGCIYVSASESQVMYTIAVMFSETIIGEVGTFIDNIVENAIGWAHDGDANVPLDKYGEDVEDLLLERVPFWNCVNSTVREFGPFMPIRVFRHSAQSYYSKTRGGVDGSSQTRAVLKSSSSAQKWEQKIVTHTFKTILVNAFVSWRMLEKEDLLRTKDSFGDLQRYRQRLNRVQCMSDYAVDTALELLHYAEQLQDDENENEDEQRVLSTQERLELFRRARKGKRKRIIYFNSGDGLELRLNIPNHPHVIGERDIYCALCGQNNGKSFRGHRTNHKCGYCDVHLCIKVRTGYRKSCWETWHTSKKLKPRAPIPYKDTIQQQEVSDEEADNASSPAEELPDAQMNDSPRSTQEQGDTDDVARDYVRTRKRRRVLSES